MVGSLLAEIVPTWAISFWSLVGFDRRLELADQVLHGLVDAALDRHRVVTRGDHLGALDEDRPGEDGRGGGSVTGHVRGLRGDLLDHLRAHVLELVLELDLLGDGDAVLGDVRRAERLLEHNVATLGPEGHGHRVGENVHAGEDLLPGIAAKANDLGSHS